MTREPFAADACRGHNQPLLPDHIRAERIFPEHWAEFVERANEAGERIRRLKAQTPGNWYPFDSLTALSILSGLLAGRFEEIEKRIRSAPVLDLGCADGDLACVFSLLGASVDAVDSSPTNFNNMRGVRDLASVCGAAVNIYDADLDSRAELTDSQYGLTLFLGTLYHLKNPYYLLERLAYRTSWCLLSTRIAQVTPRTRSPIEAEPVAYLANGLEIDDDATNYWIFSAAGLLRIVQRTRWAVWGVTRVGCLDASDPISTAGDERMFLLLQSRVLYPQLQARRGEG